MKLSQIIGLHGFIACGMLSATPLFAREQPPPKPVKPAKPEVQQPLSTQNDTPISSNPDDMFGGKVSLEDIGSDLIKRLSKGEQEASDAAYKLSQMGKRMVPQLAAIVSNSKNENEKYWAAMALSKMRHKTAAQAMLPILRDEKADRKLRQLAMDAVAGESLDEAAPDLIKIAKGKDAEFRSKALSALSVMIQSWPACESLFVESLEDPNSDVRTLAVTVCLQAAVYKTPFKQAEDKLMGMLKTEEVGAVKAKAMAALGRMKSGRTVKILIEMLGDKDISAPVLKQCLGTLQTITEVPLRDAPNALAWWDKFGKTRYENAPPLATPEDLIRAADPTLARKKEGDATEGISLEPKETASAPPVVKAPPTVDKPYRPKKPEQANAQPPVSRIPDDPPPSRLSENPPPPPPPVTSTKKKKMIDDSPSEGKPFSGLSIE